MSGAALFLHLQALGLRLELVEKPEDPLGIAIRTSGLGCLEPDEQERVRRLVRGHKPALVALLRSGSPDALAVAGGRLRWHWEKPGGGVTPDPMCLHASVGFSDLSREKDE